MASSPNCGTPSKKGPTGHVLDGSDIMELVGNERVFTNFVDHKFQELGKDNVDKLSVKEFHPAVADYDHVYSEVLNGKQDNVSKIEFKEVLTDILIGMAAGLKRDPIVILRIDGEDLHEFISNPCYEQDIVSVYSQIEPQGSVRDYIIKALEKLTVDQGMPPPSDPWVMSNIVEPALQYCISNEREGPIPPETFLVEFNKVAQALAQHLKDQPVIVAHSENTFDGSAIKRLLLNKFELDKLLTSSMEDVPKDRNGKMSKEYVRVALDAFSPSAGLPLRGAVNEMDKVVDDVIKTWNVDDGKAVKEEEFKKLLTEILRTLMLQLEANPISLSSNTVVHEPLASSSSLLQTSSQE